MNQVDNIMALVSKVEQARVYEWDVSEKVQAYAALRTAVEALAKDAWASGFRAGDSWRIDVDAHYQAENYNPAPAQPKNPYEAMKGTPT